MQQAHQEATVPQGPREDTDSRTLMERLGRRIEWAYSYVTHNRVYVVYRVPNDSFEPSTVE